MTAKGGAARAALLPMPFPARTGRSFRRGRAGFRYGHHPVIARIQAVDVLVFAGLDFGIKSGELAVGSDDVVDRAGDVAGFRPVAGEGRAVDGVDAIEQFAGELRIMPQIQQCEAKTFYFLGWYAVREIVGDGTSANLIGSRGVGFAERLSNRVFDQMRVPGRFPDDIDGEVERLRDFGDAFGIIGRVAVVHRT